MAWPRLTPLDFTLTQGGETTKTRAAIDRSLDGKSWFQG